MKYVALLALLSSPLLGCGPPHADTQMPPMLHSCDSSTWVAFSQGEVRSERAINCAQLKFNVGLASAMIGGVRPGTTYAPCDQHISLYVRNAPVWWFHGYAVLGRSHLEDNVNWIEINASTGSLLHEMLHTKDVCEGIMNTSNHPAWLERGYFDLINTYAHAVNALGLTP